MTVALLQVPRTNSVQQGKDHQQVEEECWLSHRCQLPKGVGFHS